MSNGVFTNFIKSPLTIGWLILLGALLPWLGLRLQQVTHSDVLWLSDAAARLLDGAKMSEAAYDPNPPLSIILYTLPVLLQKVTQIPLHFGVLLQSFFILLCSTFVLLRSLQSWTGLENQSRHILVGGYLLLNTIGAALVFGERDHLIGMVLPPLIVIQLSLTFGKLKPSKSLWLFCGLAALLILLKPPHGLLPTLFIAHRLYVQRSLKGLKDPDFIALTAMTLLYAATLFLFFKDYIEIILPDMLRYYFPSTSDPDLWRSLLSLLTVCGGLGLAGFFLRNSPAARNLVMLFAFCAAASIVPIAVQMKGFYYHYLPAFSFLSAGCALLIYEWILHETRHASGAALTTLLIGLTTAYIAAPLDYNYPRHATYLSLPLPALTESQGNPDSIYIFNSDMALSHEIAYYGHAVHGSRFPSLWFLPGLYDARARNLPNWEADRDRFANMMAQDLGYYKPELVLLLDPAALGNHLDPLEIFSQNPRFQTEWAHYHYVQSTTVDQGAYFGNALRTELPKDFRIFRRNKTL